MEDFFDNWKVQVRKGVLELSILMALEKKEYYGYELVKKLVQIPGLQVAEGSIYPLLSRLRKQELVDTKLIESTEGPARKYYKLTPNGKKQAKAMQVYFDSVVNGLSDLKNNNDSKKY